MQPDRGSRDPAYLWDMLEASKETMSMTCSLSQSQFLEDRVILRATERTLEIIGEAARKVSDDFRTRHPEIPWRAMVGLRNVLAHEYGHIDYSILYKTVIEDIPTLVGMLHKLLEELEQ